MAVIEFDIYEEDDINGTPLGTIDDQDALDLGFEIHWRKPGTGYLLLNRHHAKADLIQNDRYVKCRVPLISGDPLFGWWMRTGSVVLSHANEQGGELLQMEGPGARDILRFARLLEQTYAPIPPASAERGSSTDQGLWRWLAQHRGAIAARVMEEGQNQAIGGLDAPLSQVTFDWDRTDDSNSIAWSDDIEQIEQRIGIDAETFMQMLEEAGGFTLFADPNLLFHAYQDYPHDDQTGDITFQAGEGGTVAPNVASQMVRELDSTDRWNAILVDGMANVDGGYEEVTDGSPTGIAHIGYIATPSSGPDYAELIAHQTMAYSQVGVQRLVAEIDPDTHLPDPTRTNGYWLYDLVHVQSNDGAGAWDIDEDKHVSAIRIGIRRASSDLSSGHERDSLLTTVILDDDPIFEGGEPEV